MISKPPTTLDIEHSGMPAMLIASMSRYIGRGDTSNLRLSVNSFQNHALLNNPTASSMLFSGIVAKPSRIVGEVPMPELIADRSE